MSGSGTEVAHKAQDMDTSGETSHDGMSDYMSQGPQYAA